MFLDVKFEFITFVNIFRKVNHLKLTNDQRCRHLRSAWNLKFRKKQIPCTFLFSAVFKTNITEIRNVFFNPSYRTFSPEIRTVDRRLFFDYYAHDRITSLIAYVHTRASNACTRLRQRLFTNEFSSHAMIVVCFFFLFLPKSAIGSYAYSDHWKSYRVDVYEK